MIWRTADGRWLARYGKWHAWFAWYPVHLEPPIGARSVVPVERAWLTTVWRLGIIVLDHRRFLYIKPEDVALEQPAQRPRKQAPKLRIVR